MEKREPMKKQSNINNGEIQEQKHELRFKKKLQIRKDEGRNR